MKKISIILQGLVTNEILGYFLVKIQTFLLQIGISQKGLRFRQHLSNEMAHYAMDCWDAECLLESGWVECVGCADRSAYDLVQHEKASGTQLKALRKLTPPKEIDVMRLIVTDAFLDKMKLKKRKKLRNYFKSLPDVEHKKLANALKTEGYALKFIEFDQEIYFGNILFLLGT